MQEQQHQRKIVVGFDQFRVKSNCLLKFGLRFLVIAGHQIAGAEIVAGLREIRIDAKGIFPVLFGTLGALGLLWQNSTATILWRDYLEIFMDDSRWPRQPLPQISPSIELFRVRFR